MFKNPFSFNGRIRRTEYALSLLIYYASFLVIGFAMEAIEQAMPYLSVGLAVVYFFVIIWFMLAQGTKRCHDRGNHGAFQLIPFYGLWMLFADGEPFTNQYGDDPKGRGLLMDELLKEADAEA